MLPIRRPQKSSFLLDGNSKCFNCLLDGKTKNFSCFQFFVSIFRRFCLLDRILLPSNWNCCRIFSCILHQSESISTPIIFFARVIKYAEYKTHPVRDPRSKIISKSFKVPNKAVNVSLDIEWETSSKSVISRLLQELHFCNEYSIAFKTWSGYTNSSVSRISSLPSGAKV